MPSTERIQQHRRYLMCRPEHFTVSYEINPWMSRSRPTDTARAVRQWQVLHDTYLALGHEVELIDPIPGYPDMVYTANGGLVIDGVALGSRFRVSQRRGEESAFLAWFAEHGFTAVEPVAVQEGEGDILPAGDVILAGHGFRSTLDSHAEISRLFDREVISLRLVNPAYYHLDTALCVLDPVQGPGGVDRVTLAYRPAAFDEPSRAVLAERFPEALTMPDDGPASLALNVTSDGRNVVIPPEATWLEGQLREHGYHPVTVDVSELNRGGGGIKCCTLELRGAQS